MRCVKLKAIFAALALSAQLVAPLHESQAGPILDWLFHHKPAVPVYAEPMYAPQALAAPAVSYGTACDPCGPQVAQRVVTNYAPQTCFRTAWVQVPVTNYRPITTVNPASGCPVTTLSPCTTQMWQARRLPSYAYRPVFTACAAPAAVVAPLATAACAPVAGPACGTGCNSCGVQAPAAAPYYSPSTTIMPSNSVAPGAPGVRVPAVAAPTFAAPGVPTPADSAPSLSPGGLPVGPTIRNFPAYDDRLVPTQDPTLSLPLNSPTGLQKKPSKEGGLRFVPDPDAPTVGDEPNRAPKLLNPREKTAAKSLRHTWAHTPIHWSDVRQASAETPAPREHTGAVPATVAPAGDVWDDTGWRSLRQ